MKTVTDIRPSALLKAFDWGTGCFVRHCNGGAINISDAAMLIKRGNAEPIQCFCLMGAIRVAFELGAFRDRDDVRVQLLCKLRATATSEFFAGIEGMNDSFGMTKNFILNVLQMAETEVGLTQPIPIPS